MDDDYIDPSSRRKRASRPSYSGQWNPVAQRQNLRKTSSGYEIDSVVTPGVRIKLDSQKRERVPNHHYPNGKPQKPALDHDIQYANIREQHEAIVHRERKKPKLTRKSSFDLNEAFRAAVADPTNLSIKTHHEHATHGRALKTGQFPKSRQDKAKKLIEKHYVPTMNQAKSEVTRWSRNRQSYAVPAPASHSNSSTSRRRSTRSRRKSQRYAPY